MTDFRVRFGKPAKLGQDAALALEDYARAISSRDAVVIFDAKHKVTAVSLAAGSKPVPDSVAQDIQMFYESLTAADVDKLGWS